MILNAASLAILSQAVDLRFNAGLDRPFTPHDTVAMTVPSSAGENIYPYLDSFGFIREWVGDRELQNIAKGDFKIANKTFEETHGVPRESIEDDTYGLYGPMFEQVGQNTAAFPSEKVFGQLKLGLTEHGPDGQYFFDTDHPVGDGVASNLVAGGGEAWFIIDSSRVFKPLIWQPRRSFDLQKLFDLRDPNVFWKKQYVWGVDGRSGVGFSPFWQLAHASKAELNEANVTSVLTIMATQRSRTGRPLGVRGTHLVCSPNLAEQARKMFNRDFINAGESNPLKGRLRIVEAVELL